MHKILLILLVILTEHSFALTEQHIQKLKNKKDITYEDLAHENLGCPENSICSQSSGKKYDAWIKFIRSLYKVKQAPKRYKMLEAYRKKHGLPIQFLIKNEKHSAIDPILWNSRCAHHNLKNKIFKGIDFFRNDPKSKLYQFKNVKWNQLNFAIPYGDQPILIKKNKLIVVKDAENLLYTMSISQNGKWKIDFLPPTLIDKAISEKQDIQCKKTIVPNEFFKSSYCTKILNADTNTLETIEQAWSCP